MQLRDGLKPYLCYRGMTASTVWTDSTEGKSFQEFQADRLQSMVGELFGLKSKNF